MRRVLLEAWQVQCCGEPFQVGSTVVWNVDSPGDRTSLATVLGPEGANAVDFIEDHHDLATDMNTIRGTVVSIDAVFCRYERTTPSSSALVPASETAAVERRTRADGLESDGPHGRRFIGYLVDLDEARS